MHSQTFNALCDHVFDVFKDTLQTNVRIVLKLFQVKYKNYNLKYELQATTITTPLRIVITKTPFYSMFMTEPSIKLNQPFAGMAAPSEAFHQSFQTS